MVDRQTEQLLLKVADYESAEKQRFSRRVCGVFVAALLAFILYGVLQVAGLDTQGGYEQLATVALGIIGGALMIGVLYTSGYLAKIKAFKKRLLHRADDPDAAAAGDGGPKTRRRFCRILSAVLFIVGIVCGIAALLGHSDGYAAAMSCICASSVLVVQMRRRS